MSSDPIWSRPEPGARRARFTREQIAAAALAIADAEGLDAVSMRRVAAELDAGTMTLYHYVRSRDELIALMDDAIMGELLVPEEALAGGWRVALTAIARQARAVSSRHPWTIDSRWLRSAQFGPNGLRHAEQSLAALDGLGLDFRERFELLALVDEYVLGYVVHRSGGAAFPVEPLAEFIDEQLATGSYPQLERIVREQGTREGVAQLAALLDDEDRFERGLQRLLDGIALEVERSATQGRRKAPRQ